MTNLTQLLQKCDKEVLVEVVENMCVMFQDKYLDCPDGGSGLWEDWISGARDIDRELESQSVKKVVCQWLTTAALAKKRQQKRDRDAFAIVLGARTNTEVGKTPTSTSAVGRERAWTGLLVVGTDASRVNVPVVREIEAPATMGG